MLTKLILCQSTEKFKKSNKVSVDCQKNLWLNTKKTWKDTER